MSRQNFFKKHSKKEVIKNELVSIVSPNCNLWWHFLYLSHHKNASSVASNIALSFVLDYSRKERWNDDDIVAGEGRARREERRTMAIAKSEHHQIGSRASNGSSEREERKAKVVSHSSVQWCRFHHKCSIAPFLPSKPIAHKVQNSFDFSLFCLWKDGCMTRYYSIIEFVVKVTVPLDILRLFFHIMWIRVGNEIVGHTLKAR